MIIFSPHFLQGCHSEVIFNVMFIFKKIPIKLHVVESSEVEMSKRDKSRENIKVLVKDIICVLSAGEWEELGFGFTAVVK